jgi:hypothetical protein
MKRRQVRASKGFKVVTDESGRPVELTFGDDGSGSSSTAALEPAPTPVGATNGPISTHRHPSSKPAWGLALSLLALPLSAFGVGLPLVAASIVLARLAERQIKGWAGAASRSTIPEYKTVDRVYLIAAAGFLLSTAGYGTLILLGWDLGPLGSLLEK